MSVFEKKRCRGANGARRLKHVEQPCYIYIIKYIEKVPEVPESLSDKSLHMNKTKSIQCAGQMLNRWTTNMVYQDCKRAARTAGIQ
jgi:hypothetical protein